MNNNTVLEAVKWENEKVPEFLLGPAVTIGLSDLVQTSNRLGGGCSRGGGGACSTNRQASTGTTNIPHRYVKRFVRP